MNSQIEKFKKNGFINFGPLVSAEIIDALADICIDIYANLDRESPSFYGGAVEGFNDLLVHDANSAVLIDNILTNEKLQNFLSYVLGVNYKIMDIGFRRSAPGDAGLYLHQDGVGQINMAICLDDNPKGNGATTLLPSSHIIHKSIHKLGLEIPSFLVNLLRPLFVTLDCKKGDICFFSNRTWHGRVKNRSTIPHDVVLIGFFPHGYSYYNQYWPNSVLNDCRSMKIFNLLGSQEDLSAAISASNCKNREDGNYFKCNDHGYSMKIEDENYLKSIKMPFQLTFKLLILFSFNLTIRMVYSPIKFLLIRNR